jgi:hypothetical protein
MGTAHDNWLNHGSDGPKELDGEAFDSSLQDVTDRISDEDEANFTDIVEIIYDAMPALNYALREVVFPEHLRPYIVALANLSADIRAKVDDEYAVRTATYDDPRDDLDYPTSSDNLGPMESF